ncbi:MAG: GDSL-type esterase/lipase family protein [Dehalococcoidia bacterium]
MRLFSILLALVLVLAVACSSGGGESGDGASDDDGAAFDDSAPVGDRSASGDGSATGDTSSNGDATPNGVYIALGDSLSEGVGASDQTATAFVPLVHDGLGEGWDLVNLGEAGDTSAQLIGHGHLDEAIALIEAGKSDDDPDNDVNLVTLEIGGNDLLNLFFDLVLPGACPSLVESLERPQCVSELRGAMDGFRPNLEQTLDRLIEADPELRIIVMTLYNPFSGDTGLATVPTISDMAQMALEGLPDTPFATGLNDTIRDEVAERGLPLVDWWPLFQDKAGQYIAQDYIHPNDAGYRVMADAVLEQVAE